MRPSPKERISKKALPLWRIKAFMETLLIAIVPIVYGILVYYYQLPTWILWVMGSGFLVFAVISIVIVPKVRWRRWRYEVLDGEVDLQYGVIVVRRTLIPIRRIQHVDTEQGPLQRKFGLATVTISTAATVHQIPALTLEVAHDLRDKISVLVSVEDEDDE